MRLLGVDFGFARIGLAVVDGNAGFPRPQPTVAASGSLKRDAQSLDHEATKERADQIILGLPLEPDGTEGKMARVVRQLAVHLENLGRTVHVVDERLTSIEAEKSLRAEPLKASERDRRRDGEAACLILERYLTDATLTPANINPQGEGS